jgi:gliding motility-associated-like protein
MRILLRIFLLFILTTYSKYLVAQLSCPPNIDFELGTFDNWECFSGFIKGGVMDVTPGAPIPYKHLIYAKEPSPFIDPYGKFPISSPNGSHYSVALGNAGTGAEVDQLKYTFTVPNSPSGYSIIFNYAVVLQNPSHEEHDQPRFQVKLYNVTRNQYIECSSYDFVAGFSQPDFIVSEVDATVFYKPWSSVTINLGAYAGQIMRLEFSVNDCGLGGHFGYAYLDINSRCTNAVLGNIVCQNTDETLLQAPTGFQEYQWYSGDLSRFLGNGSTYNVSTPVVGDSFAVVIVPYPYLGCLDTIRSKITFHDEPLNLVVKDSFQACFNEGFNITEPFVTSGSSPGIELSYFNDSYATQYILNPNAIKQSGTYYIRALNDVGCMVVKPVNIIIKNNPEFNVTIPPEVVYPDKIDLTTLTNNNNINYTYWINKSLNEEVINPMVIQKSGEYFILGKNQDNCTLLKSVFVKVRPLLYVPDAFTPNNDGKNDKFNYNALGGLKSVDFFSVYNRWGQLIFNSKTLGEGWDGSSKGQPLESGVYIWTLKVRDHNNNVIEQKGTVLLIR